MNRRQAKRLVCDIAARILDSITPERCYLGEDGEMLPDPERERLEGCWQELVDELLRRGGREHGKTLMEVFASSPDWADSADE